MIRLTVQFTGRVQGVGFRYTTQRIARRHAVAGYVQNLPDGRVKLVAEGERAEVRAFADEVADTMAGYIIHQARDESAASGEFGPPAPGALGVRH